MIVTICCAQLDFARMRLRLLNKMPRLIGSEARRREHTRLIIEKEKELQRTQKELKQLTFEQTRLNTNQTNLQKFIQLLEQDKKETTDLIGQTGDSKTKLYYGSERLKEDETLLKDGDVEVLGYRERLLELRSIISKEGLDKLEEKIRKATKQYENCQKRLEETQNGNLGEFSSKLMISNGSRSSKRKIWQRSKKDEPMLELNFRKDITRLLISIFSLRNSE